MAHWDQCCNIILLSNSTNGMSHIVPFNLSYFLGGEGRECALMNQICAVKRTSKLTNLEN